MYKIKIYINIYNNLRNISRISLSKLKSNCYGIESVIFRRPIHIEDTSFTFIFESKTQLNSNSITPLSSITKHNKTIVAQGNQSKVQHITHNNNNNEGSLYDRKYNLYGI